MAEKGEFAAGLFKAFETVLGLYESVTEGLDKKNRQLLAECRRLKDENVELRRQIEEGRDEQKAT